MFQNCINDQQIEKKKYPEKGDWVKSVNVNKLNEY